MLTEAKEARERPTTARIGAALILVGFGWFEYMKKVSLIVVGFGVTSMRREKEEGSTRIYIVADCLEAMVRGHIMTTFPQLGNIHYAHYDSSQPRWQELSDRNAAH